METSDDFAGEPPAVPGPAKLRWPAFEVLRDANGGLTNAEHDDRVAARLGLDDDAVGYRPARAPDTQFRMRMRVVRTHLKAAGLIENLERGRWRVVRGIDLPSDEPTLRDLLGEARRAELEERAAAREATADPVAPSTDAAQVLSIGLIDSEVAATPAPTEATTAETPFIGTAAVLEGNDDPLVGYARRRLDSLRGQVIDLQHEQLRLRTELEAARRREEEATREFDDLAEQLRKRGEPVMDLDL